MSKTKGIKYWKQKAWESFSQYIRLLESKDGYIICCSCGKPYPAFGKGCAQAGHFIPGRHNSILFEERAVHGQCYNCNVVLKGNWPGYIEYMRNRYGQEVIDELLIQAKKTVHLTPVELEKIRDEYDKKYQDLLDERKVK